MSAWDDAGFSTRAIHAGQDPDPLTGAVAVPVYQTSTFVQAEVGRHSGYEYARSGNPTRDALQAALASLERAAHGYAFASGLAASDAVLRTLTPGDHVVLADDVYGGTYRQFAKVHAPWGLFFDTADLGDLHAVAAAWRDTTRMLWIESPTNPLLTVFDIAELAGFAHERGALVVVDNTFATPYLQQPLSLGADVVVHSTTKYLGGHSDVVGGAVLLDDDALAERIGFLQNAIGGVPGPWDAWLTLRGVKTLAVRMRAHCAGARAVVHALVEHPSVTSVLYPGLPGHPGHAAAARQMRDFGGMVSFRMADADAAVKACARFRVFALAESLGGVESLVEHPGRMTHLSTADSPVAVPDDLVRLSVGIEDPEDLVADVEQALG
ncbi:MAG TPA: cystathionine gamma-synthase [Egibacteraceae bacterium]|jgi:cystathionine gamma-synthase|nr:cystathionine gamma-synthase [Egibacteraceae bacterium]